MVTTAEYAQVGLGSTWACVVTATADAQAAGPGQRFGLDVTAAADAHDASPLVVLLTLRCSACPTVFGW